MFITAIYRAIGSARYICRFAWSGRLIIKKKIGKKVYVVAKTLDDVVKELDLNHVDWIKIDVEGSEREVLMGSRDTIRKYTPKIVAECTINVEETLAFMKSLGYSYAKIHQNYFYFKPM
jgi:hypothetical protein